MSTALLVIDMLNAYEHEDAEPLKQSVRTVLEPIRGVIAAARERELPLIYVNDNSGDWAAGRQEIVEKAQAGAAPELVDPIAPEPGTPFVVKARHSVFYETQLEYLLRQNEIERLILVGQVTEQCILYSALDGYVRHFEITVAADCVAHIHEDLARAALRMIELNMRAEVLSGQDALARAR